MLEYFLGLTRDGHVSKAGHKMNRCRKAVIFCVLLLMGVISATPAEAQKLLRGEILDAETGLGIPGATIFPRGSALGGSVANNEGVFEIALPAFPVVLQVRHIGYLTEEIELEVGAPGFITIALTPASYTLDELVVTDEDPAYSIMRKVVEKKQERAASLGHFEAEVFSRFFLYSEEDLVHIEESVSRSYWRNKSGVRQQVQAIRFRPTTGQPFRYAKTSHVPNLTDDTIVIDGFSLMGPTHPDALDAYIFTLGERRILDSLTVYDIYFRPRTGRETGGVGFVSVLDSVYAVLEAGFRPSAENVPPQPIKTWDVYIQQQFASFGDSLWLPIDYSLEGRLTFGRTGVSYPMARFRQHSRLTRHVLSIPAPDSIFNDSRLLSVNARAGSREDLFRWNSGFIPLTPAELQEIATLDPGMTLNRAFRPMGLLRDYGAVPVVDRLDTDRKEESGETLLGSFYRGLDLRYNRVEGVYTGLKHTLQIQPGLQVSVMGGYAIAATEPAFGGSLRYAPTLTSVTQKQPGHPFLRFSAHNRIQPRYESGTHTSLFNSATTYVGWDDYFDYYKQKSLKFDVGWTGAADRNEWALFLYQDEADSIGATKTDRGWMLDRIQRMNPPVMSGLYRSMGIQFRLGDPPSATYLGGRNSLIVQYERGKGNNQWFSLAWLRAQGSLKTWVRGRQWPNALHLALIAGAGSARLPLHRYLISDTALGPFAPFGAFKSLSGIPLHGRRFASLFWEHDFTTLLFETAGLWGVARSGVGFTLHGASGFFDPYSPAEPEYALLNQRYSAYHELGASLTNFMRFPIRLDVTYSLTRKKTLFTLGIVRQF